MPKSETKLFVQLAMQLVSACASPEAAKLIPAQQHQLGLNAVETNTHLSMYDWLCSRFAALREASDTEAKSRVHELAALELEMMQAKALEEQRLLSRRAAALTPSQFGMKRAHDDELFRSVSERPEGAVDDEGDEGLAQLEVRPKRAAPGLPSHLRPKGTAGAGGNTRVVDEEQMEFWRVNIEYMQTAFYHWGIFIELWQLAVSEKTPGRRRMWTMKALVEAEKNGIFEYEPGGDALAEIQRQRDSDPPNRIWSLLMEDSVTGSSYSSPADMPDPSESTVQLVLLYAKQMRDMLTAALKVERDLLTKSQAHTKVWVAREDSFTAAFSLNVKGRKRGQLFELAGGTKPEMALVVGASPVAVTLQKNSAVSAYTSHGSIYLAWRLGVAHAYVADPGVVRVVTAALSCFVYSQIEAGGPSSLLRACLMEGKWPELEVLAPTAISGGRIKDFLNLQHAFEEFTSFSNRVFGTQDQWTWELVHKFPTVYNNIFKDEFKKHLFLDAYDATIRMLNREIERNLASAISTMDVAETELVTRALHSYSAPGFIESLQTQLQLQVNLHQASGAARSLRGSPLSAPPLGAWTRRSRSPSPGRPAATGGVVQKRVRLADDAVDDDPGAARWDKLEKTVSQSRQQQQQSLHWRTLRETQ